MRKNIFWESLVGIIIWVSVLSICILGILNLLIYSWYISDTFNNDARINVLKDNATAIVSRLNTTNLRQNEIFYLYKNQGTGNFVIYSGALNSQYKYIDALGNQVTDLTWFTDPIYARLLWLQREDDSILSSKNQIIKASIRKLIKK